MEPAIWRQASSYITEILAADTTGYRRSCNRKELLTDQTPRAFYNPLTGACPPEADLGYEKSSVETLSAGLKRWKDYHDVSDHMFGITENNVHDHP